MSSKFSKFFIEIEIIDASVDQRWQWVIHPRHNVLCLFLILLISFSDVAASIVAEETNAGVTVFVAELTPLCAVSYNVLPGHSVHVDSFHIWHAYIFVMKSYYSKSYRLCLCMTILFVRSDCWACGNNVPLYKSGKVEICKEVWGGG